MDGIILEEEMIELRWLKIHDNDIGSNHPSAIQVDSGYFHVLQYREIVLTGEISSDMDDIYHHTDIMLYPNPNPQWEDVPIVIGQRK